MRPVRLAVGVGILVVGLVFAGVLLSQTEQDTGTNTTVQVSGVALTVPATRTRCQTENVPAETDRLRVFADARGQAGPLVGEIKSGRRVVARGRLARIRGSAPHVVKLNARTNREVRNAEVCLRNAGPVNIRLAGNLTPPRGPANPVEELDFGADKPRIDYLTSGDVAWWRRAGTISDRFGLFKSDVLPDDIFWLVMALVALTAGAALVTLRRGLRAS